MVRRRYRRQCGWGASDGRATRGRGRRRWRWAVGWVGCERRARDARAFENSTNSLTRFLHAIHTDTSLSTSRVQKPKVGRARASLQRDQARGVIGERWGYQAWSLCRITRPVSSGPQSPRRRRRRPRPRAALASASGLVPNWNALLPPRARTAVPHRWGSTRCVWR